LTEVVLPARNGPDLEDVPEEVREQMTFHLAERVEDVLGPVLGIDVAPVESGPVEAGSDGELSRVA
jgi:ATP-dependent Lon protease